MTLVKSLSSQGITICATIHSPTAYVFSLFDRLLMLLKGRVSYFGPNSELQACAVCVCIFMYGWVGGRRAGGWVVVDRRRAGEVPTIRSSP
jgi:hypothetical protein